MLLVVAHPHLDPIQMAFSVENPRIAKVTAQGGWSSLPETFPPAVSQMVVFTQLAIM
jgi:hypothetical protein